MSRFSVEATFRAVDRMTRPIGRIERSMRRFERRTRQSMRAMNRVSSGVLRGIGAVGTAAAAAGAAVAVVGADVARTGASFEQAITSAASKMDGGVRRGTAAYAALEAAARAVGAETEHSSSAAAEGLGFLAQAGFSAEQSIAALPRVVNLATATSLELGRASDILTDSMGPLGLATEDAAQMQLNLARVSDVLAATSSSTNTNVEQMFEAIRAGGNMATGAGQSVETFAALVGAMANDGIKGEQAGTALRNMFMRLEAPSARARRTLSGLNVDIDDGSGNMRDMTDIIGDLAGSMEGMGNIARQRALAEIFGARAVGPAMSLINQGADSIRGLREQLESAGGATDRMADQMRDTTQGDMASFQSTIESVKLAIFDVVRGPLREVIQSITAWARANREVIASGIQDFINWIRDNSETILVWGRRIGIAVAVLGTAALAVGAVSAAMAVFNAVVALSPVGLVILAIVAAIALVAAFWPEITAAFEEAWEGWKLLGLHIAGFFVGIWESIVEAATSAWDWVSGVFTGFVDGAVSAFQGLKEFIAGLAVLMIRPWLPVLRPVLEFVGSVVDWITGKWNRLKMWFSILWPFLRQGFTQAWTTLREGVSGVTTWVADMFGKAWGRVVSLASIAVNNVKEAWGEIAGFFSTLWTGIVATFNATIGGIASTIATMVEGVNRIRGVGSSATSGGAGTAGEMSSPQERSSHHISENTTRSSATVEIRDRTGRARMTGGGPGITFQPSGAM